MVMLRHGLDRDFPFFFKYTVLQVVSVALLVIVQRLSPCAYFYSDWIVAALCVLISFAVIDELFKAAFQQFAALRDLGKIAPRWAMVVVLLAAAVAALSSGHIPQPQKSMARALRAATRIPSLIFRSSREFPTSTTGFNSSG